MADEVAIKREQSRVIFSFCAQDGAKEIVNGSDKPLPDLADELNDDLEGAFEMPRLYILRDGKLYEARWALRFEPCALGEVPDDVVNEEETCDCDCRDCERSWAMSSLTDVSPDDVATAMREGRLDHGDTIPCGVCPACGGLCVCCE